MSSTTPQLTDPARPSTLQSSWGARLLGPLEELPWLEKASATVMGWLKPWLEHPNAPPFKDLLHGRWLGHALHPVMVDLPIGFWTSAMLLDLVGAGKSARLLTAAGCAGAVGAAATGIADWSVTDGRERRLGMLHGMLNLTGLAFQLASLPSRRHYRLLSWTGSAIATASAYLGGELVFGRGQMVDHDAWLAGPAAWTPACPETELADGSAKAAEVAGRQVLLYRLGNRVSAMEDACSHAGGPLHDGTVENGVVTCPWHGSQFSLADGACLRGPATYPQLRLEARIRGGVIEVRGRKG